MAGSTSDTSNKVLMVAGMKVWLYNRVEKHYFKDIPAYDVMITRATVHSTPAVGHPEEPTPVALARVESPSIVLSGNSPHPQSSPLIVIQRK